jgi:RNA polymerase sigma-70 factor (ECF subfamily)
MLDFRDTVQSAQDGNEEAFARLWREYQPGLLRYLRIKASPVAEDLAADIWLRVLKALPSFEGDEQGFRGWLYTTARNRLTDWYRTGERRPDLIEYSSLVILPAVNNVEDEVAERSATERAVALIAELPPDQAEAVMLRIVVGLDVARVADLMERSPGSIRVLCHRGLRRLEQRLVEIEQPTPVPAGAGVDEGSTKGFRLHAGGSAGRNTVRH